MSYDAEVLADAPLSYWKLDETSGTVAVDAMGAHDGTYAGSTTFGVPGIAGGAGVAFPTETDGIEFGDVYRFAGLSPFSLEGWVRPENEPNNVTGLILHKQVGNDTPYGMKYEQFSGDNLDVQVFRFGPGFVDLDWIRTDDAPVVFHELNHVVGTFDGSTIRLFVNAVLKKSIVSAVSVPDVVAALQSGYESRQDALPTGFDALAIYDHALSPERIAAHYAAGIAAPAAAGRAGLIHARRDGHGIGS